MQDAHIDLYGFVRVFHRWTHYLADFVALAEMPVTDVLKLLLNLNLGFFNQRSYQVHNDHNDPLTTPQLITIRISIEHVKRTCAGCRLLNCLGLTKPW